MEFRIGRGVPTDEEIAAVVGVLLTRSAPVALAPEPVSRWASSARPGAAFPDGRPSRRGTDGWRSSALPR
jgi:hypothetical protein